MHVFPYVRCLPILDKNTLTNIADIGRESVHDINKIRARRTGTRIKTRMLVFLRLCFISLFFSFSRSRYHLSIFFGNFFFFFAFVQVANESIGIRDWAVRHTNVEIKREGSRKECERSVITRNGSRCYRFIANAVVTRATVLRAMRHHRDHPIPSETEVIAIFFPFFFPSLFLDRIGLLRLLRIPLRVPRIIPRTPRTSQ